MSSGEHEVKIVNNSTSIQSNPCYKDKLYRLPLRGESYLVNHKAMNEALENDLAQDVEKFSQA